MPKPPKRKNAPGAGRPKKEPTKTLSFRVRSDIKDALKVILDPIVKREEMKLINDKIQKK